MEFPDYFFHEDAGDYVSNATGDSHSKCDAEVDQTYEVIFAVKRGQPIINSIKHYVTIYPDHTISFQQQGHLCNKESDEAVLKVILKNLDLNETDVIAWSIFPSGGKAFRMEVLVRKSLQNASTAQKAYVALGEKVRRETQQLKNTIREEFLTTANEKESRSYIQKKYLTLANIYKSLLRRSNVTSLEGLFRPPVDYGMSDQILLSLHYMDQCLQFLAAEYEQYMSDTAIVPMIALLREQKKAAPICDSIIASLSKLMNAELYAVVSEPIDRLMHAQTDSFFSYAELRYCLRFIEQLHAAIHADHTIAEAWPGILIELNFNTRSFMQYYIGFLQKQIAAQENTEDVIQFLLEFQKGIRQTLCLDSAFDPLLPSAKDHLLSWVEAELYYWEKMAGGEVCKSTTRDQAENAKLTVGVSVSKLALLFSLLEEAKVIVSESKLQLFRFIADNFRTSSRENISYKSISTKCYDPENSAIEAVSELLEVMKQQLMKR